MPKLVLNPAVASSVATIKANPPHALLLHGEHGVGLHTIAQTIASNPPITILPVDKKGEPEHTNGHIGVDVIRHLYKQTRGQGSRTTVIIDDGDRMTASAQNALLKLLEEPPANVHFIITSHQPSGLLETIRSRVSELHVSRVSRQSSQELLRQKKLTDEATTKLLFIAEGRPAELIRLSRSQELLEQASMRMKDARMLLSAPSVYDRASVALRYANSRQEAIELTDSALHIMGHTLKTAPSYAVGIKTDGLLAMRRAIAANASPRLQLMSFVLK